MDFTSWVESLKSVAQVLAGFGLVTVLLAWFKHTSERRSWRRFKRLANDWVDRLVESERHPNTLAEVEWKAECEQLLSDANFSPLHVQQLPETSVIVAKGIAADKFFL